jgi:hypothetical protein
MVVVDVVVDVVVVVVVDVEVVRTVNEPPPRETTWPRASVE